MIDSGHVQAATGRTNGVRLYLRIVTASAQEGKRKILITEISVLYALWLIDPIKNLNRLSAGGRSDCAMLSAKRSQEFMKIAGFLLLLSGWLLVVFAVMLLRTTASRGAFVLAGLGVQGLALVLASRTHRLPKGGHS